METWSSTTTDVFTRSFQLDYKIEVEASVLFVKAKSTTELTVEQGGSTSKVVSEGKTATNISSSSCLTLQCQAPAFTHVKCSAIEFKGSVTVPFTADEVSILDDGHEDVKQITGSYSSASSYDLRAVIEGLTPRSVLA